jgi:hypothetical protein
MMQILESHLAGQNYLVGPALPNLGGDFYRGYIHQHDVTLRLASTADPEAVFALEYQLNLIQNLNHRLITTALDWGHTPDYFFLVLEGPFEHTLDELLHVTHIDVLTALNLSRQVLEVLTALHNSELVWGRLRPQAFAVDQANRLKLLDLHGVGESSSSRPPFAPAEASYVAPECWAGHPPTQSSDVYAWAVLTYELLAGRLPFTSTQMAALAIQHLSEEPPDIRLTRPDIGDALADLIHRCLSKTPDERPPNVAMLSRELDDLYQMVWNETQARMVVCPRCNSLTYPDERCSLCNLSFVIPPVIQPQQHRRTLSPKLLGIPLIIGLVLFSLQNGQQRAAQTPITPTVDMQVSGMNTAMLPPAKPTPVPTATAVPTPRGTLSVAAKDVADPNIDIIRVRASIMDDALVTELYVAGRIYERVNQATYQFFLDTDNNAETGELSSRWPTLGANYLVLYRSGDGSGMLLRWNGTVWEGTHAIPAEVQDGRLMLRVPTTLINVSSSSHYGVLASSLSDNLADSAPRNYAASVADNE